MVRRDNVSLRLDSLGEILVPTQGVYNHRRYFPKKVAQKWRECMAKLHKITWFQRISRRPETDKIFSRVHFTGNFIGRSPRIRVRNIPKGVIVVASGRAEQRREGHPSLQGIHIRRARVRTVEQLDKMIAVQFATFQRGRLYTHVAAIEQSVSIVL